MVKMLVLGVIFYIGICSFMFFRQERLLFPSHLAPFTQKVSGTLFKANDGTLLETKIFDANNKKDPVLIVFTGNAQNALLTSEVIWNGFENNMHVATMNYRSYGYSEGSPTEENIFADGLAYTQYIKTQYPNQKIYLLGISLGTGVVSYIASQEPVDGLILMTPYDSITNVGKAQYPFLPIELLIKHKFDSTKHIQTVQAPVAIIRAGDDRVILNERTENLVKFIPNIAYDVTLANMAHTEILFPSQKNNLKETLEKALENIQIQHDKTY